MNTKFRNNLEILYLKNANTPDIPPPALTIITIPVAVRSWLLPLEAEGGLHRGIRLLACRNQTNFTGARICAN